MRFLNYIRTLFPTFSKYEVVESIEVTRNSIKEHTLPAYETAAELWKGQKFVSKEAQEMEKMILSKVSGKSIFEVVRKALDNSIVTLEKLGDKSKVIYADTEANLSLTFVKSTVLRLTQTMEFGNTYARRLINYLYAEEVAHARKEKLDLPPAEIKWLKDGVSDFAICINVMSLKYDAIEKHLNGLPDATITDLTEKTFMSTMGEGKLDPMLLRHLSVKVNPFYLYGMYKAKKEADRYKAAKEELELVQLRLLQLQKQQSGQEDAKLDKEIEYMQNRVSGLVYKLNEMEKEYGL